MIVNEEAARRFWPNQNPIGRCIRINADTAVFMQVILSDLFKNFPKLKFIIPHGGGAVPYHWGRYRGLAQDMKRPPLAAMVSGSRLPTSACWAELSVSPKTARGSFGSLCT